MAATAISAMYKYDTVQIYRRTLKNHPLNRREDSEEDEVKALFKPVTRSSDLSTLEQYKNFIFYILLSMYFFSS